MFRKPRQQTLKADLTTRVSRCAVCLRGKPRPDPDFRDANPETSGGYDPYYGLPEVGAFQRPGSGRSRNTNPYTGYRRTPDTRQFEKPRRRQYSRQREG